MRAPLPVEILAEGEFSLIGCWQLDAAASLVLIGTVPDEPGVYAFTMNGIAQYIGVASTSLSRRLYFYRNPGPTQKTNIRLNATLREALAGGEAIDIYVATPPALHWNGWIVSGPEGLEAGIINTYMLPWNLRGTSRSIAGHPAAPASRLTPPGEAFAPAEPADKPGTRQAPAEPSRETVPTEPSMLPRPLSGSKYLALCEFLRGCSQDKVSMTFARIEQLVGPLPKSATLHRAWWANHEGNAQAKGWMSARFMAEPDPVHRTVVFRRFSC